MTDETLYGTRLIGQTEKTLSAILDRLLTGSGVTEPQWVALTVTVNQGAAPATAAAERVAASLKISPRAGAAVLTSLIESGLVEIDDAGTTSVSRTGHELYQRVHGHVAEITGRVWGDIPADERETAASVLHTTLLRAAAELTALAPDATRDEA
ncbi:hypothetical protein [Nocardioides sp. Iso805N]|uniref:hypothetical protein n=1 Tax=Nocardioides sp. Iso805N TaxID=1283287 RepID=UPI000373CA13|nr:hypothetical protein [Nocardioides sp. Iso805N]